MIGLDTNILVRYFTQDDEVQAELAANIIKTQKNKPSSFFITNVVICELIWVLVKGYDYEKKQITNVIKTLLSAIEFSFEHYELIWQVVLEYEKAKADFSDILIGMLGELHGCSYTITFDNKACNLKEFKNVPGELDKNNLDDL